MEERTEENKKQVEKDTIFYEDYQKNLKSRQTLESWKQETNKKASLKVYCLKFLVNKIHVLCENNLNSNIGKREI